MQKPHKHYDEGEELCRFEPCHKEGHPLVHVLAQEARRKTMDFFPKICSTYLVIFTPWTVFWESCHFSSEWNHLWFINASLALKWLTNVLKNYGSVAVHIAFWDISRRKSNAAKISLADACTLSHGFQICLSDNVAHPPMEHSSLSLMTLAKIP